jgi:hypothetical protein
MLKPAPGMSMLRLKAAFHVLPMLCTRVNASDSVAEAAVRRATHPALAQQGGPSFVAERGGCTARKEGGRGADRDDVAKAYRAGQFASEGGAGALAE